MWQLQPGQRQIGLLVDPLPEPVLGHCLLLAARPPVRR